MAGVKRRRRRPSQSLPKRHSNQKNWAQLAVSLGALLMVLGLGDRFASGAAGCYGAVTTDPETTKSPTNSPDESVQPSRSTNVRRGMQVQLPASDEPSEKKPSTEVSRKGEKSLDSENRSRENKLQKDHIDGESQEEIPNSE